LPLGRVNRRLGRRLRPGRCFDWRAQSGAEAVITRAQLWDSNCSAFAAEVRALARYCSHFAAQYKFWIVRLRCRGHSREDATELLFNFDVLQVWEFRGCESFAVHAWASCTCFRALLYLYAGLLGT